MDCFKKYDVRGILGEQLNNDIAYKIGVALARVKQAKTAVVGADARESSPELKEALTRGLIAQGVDVIDIGTTGTEEIYFATQDLNTDLGIQITASHNPINYNGIKFVGKGAAPFSEVEFQQVKALASEPDQTRDSTLGTKSQASNLNEFVQHLMGYIDTDSLKPFKIVVNAGNGVAGHVIDAIESEFSKLSLEIEFVKLLHEPDHTFPNGIPNPLLPEDRVLTSEAVKEHQADLGIAWDGDFDRCFLFDENGKFIEGYYIVGLLAQSFLLHHPKEKVVYDPRLTWNTEQIVEEMGGTPIMSQTGHVLIKREMRKHNAIYGGEMSAHHYFRDFGYCDSGMIPWLLVLNLLSKSDQPLSKLVNQMINNYPASGEVNFRVASVTEALDFVEQEFSNDAVETQKLDGLSMTFKDWRFNLRGSNTEPLLRLNIESKGNAMLVTEKLKLISNTINELQQKVQD